MWPFTIRSERRGPAAAVAAAAAIAASTFACTDPFALREGEPPQGDLPAWWSEPRSPDELLADLEGIYEHRAWEYMGNLLASDFVFDPDPQDVFDDGSRFDSLDVALETLATRLLLESVEADPILLLTPDGGDPKSPVDTTTYRRSYTMTLVGFATPGDTVEVDGSSVFRMRQDPSDARWRLYQWRDRRGARTWSWGRTKLAVLP